jgi:hypothetical protein
MREARVETQQEQRRLRLLKEIMCSHNAWGREARVLLAVAQEHGVRFDDDMLMTSDVRDLQAMQVQLQAASHRGPRAACLIERIKMPGC